MSWNWIHTHLTSHLVGVTAFALASVVQARSAEGASAQSTTKRRTHELAEAHYDVVWRVLRRLGLSPSQADDGAQQVFLIAMQRLADIDSGKDRAFLCSTAVWVGRRLRAGRRREELTDEVPEQTSDSQPDEETERRRMRALLDSLLQQLDDEFREVLVLVELEGLSKREVADALGIPEGTVASRTRRGREKLEALARAHLEKGGQP